MDLKSLPVVKQVIAVVDWFSVNNARSWWSHFLICWLVGWIGGAITGSWWPVVAIVAIYWGREVFQIWRRGAGFPFKWKDDLPDFGSALLGGMFAVALLF